ncbi:MAG: hypothetical protein IJ775_05820 [Muribaculaceae bacterium]|nr:hypothetical protein [Muribaculaceae bacterium]
MMALLAISVSASDYGTIGNYTVTKISNPDRGEREVDGLLPGGFRENSYTWRMAARGDEIYIATARNLANGVVNMFAPAMAASGISTETLWSITDAITNGDVPHNGDTGEGANIISYNRKTGEWKVIYTESQRSMYFRMAVTFGDNVYFGTYSANASMPQYLLKLDKDGNFTKVFETEGSVSLRANCVYDGHLFFAGADAREVIEPGVDRPVCKMAVLRKSNEDDTQWDRVADYKDFGEYAFNDMMFNTTGCPVWELATHNGYIYASGPSTEGMIIFRGHPAAAGEKANEYGWYWEEIAGLNNGINNPGLSEIEGGEPNTYRSIIGSVYEFNGELYAYTFDHTVGGMTSAISGILSTVLGKRVKASDYLAYMYSTLTHPQKIWKLNDVTGKFEECINFTQLTEGTTNEYIWRMGEYDGQLYISTMDSGVAYGYLTQLTNGSFFNMTKEERQQKIQYIQNVIDILIAFEKNEFVKSLIDKLEQLKDFLNNFDEDSITNENFLALLEHYQELIDNLLESLNNYLNSGLIESIAQSQLQENSDQNILEALNALAAIAGLPENDYGSIHDRALIQLSHSANYNSVENDLITYLQDLFKKALDNVAQSLQEIRDRIDVDGIRMYLYINKMVKDDEWGFDLFRTSDGVNFEVVTRDGFGDKYNYGCPSFLATEEGLYIGTCNPFYGGQLHLLTNKKQAETAISDIEIEKKESNTYFTPSGMRINGKPTQPGIYIHDGRKVIVTP